MGGASSGCLCVWWGGGGERWGGGGGVSRMENPGERRGRSGVSVT